MSCRRATQLLSESMDHTLGTRERLALRWHLLACGACRRYFRQLAFIRRVVRRDADLLLTAIDRVSLRLSPVARKRIRRMLEERAASG